MQSMAHRLVLHDNSLQPAKLAYHTDRQVPLNYVVAKEQDNDHP
jgi:hypothetical protein